MKKGIENHPILIMFFCAWLLPAFLMPFSSAQAEISTTEAYLEELQVQGKQRVIVIFKDEVDPALIDEYGGTLIRVFTTIKALVCEIPEENIELLKQEETVEDVVPDAVMKMQFGDVIQSGYGYKERDPEELAEIVDSKAWSLIRPKDRNGEPITEEDFYRHLQQHPEARIVLNMHELQGVVEKYASSPRLETDAKVVLYFPEDVIRYAPQVRQAIEEWSGTELACGKRVEVRSMRVWSEELSRDVRKRLED